MGLLGEAACEAWSPTLVGPDERRHSSTDQLGKLIADDCAPIGDLFVDSGAGARAKTIVEAIAPPPGLGEFVAEAPMRKLTPLTKLSTIAEERSAAQKKMLRRTPIPGRGAFHDLFRESRRAFQEADAELVAEALREECMRDT